MSARQRSWTNGHRPLGLWWRIIIGASAVLGGTLAGPAGKASDLDPVKERPLTELASAPGAATVADLSLVLLPARKPSPVMAIIYSGDGGWRDLDKEIGEKLQAMGIPVVGFDTLKYFWENKSPEVAAASLAEIIDHFTQVWQVPNVALIGYSFGADVLPFIVNRLPDAERARVRQISLLALGMRVDFEIHIRSWVGAPPSKDAPRIAPELQRLDPGLLQCVYGVEEKVKTACVLLAQAEVIETPGGHHFDGDYRAITRRIVDGLVRRGALPAPG